ncbi:MAG: PASTA domain-containing protein [Bacteroidales bacterium]|nr:PASTA domain-containing protein [Bacteroidales bacterium]
MKTKNAWWISIVAIVLILLLTAVCVSSGLRSFTRHGREKAVPDFTGISLEDAYRLASANDLRIEVVDSLYARSMERGFVFRQSPEPGMKVKSNRRILLTINAVLAQQVCMPSLVGASLRQAKTDLAACGLLLGRLIYEDDIATNNVLAQQVKGEEVSPGTMIPAETVVDLVLGLDEADNHTYIPNVIGADYLSARDLLFENSLNVSTSEFDSTVKTYADSLEARVWGMRPFPSDTLTIPFGTDVTLYLTLDPQKLKTGFASLKAAADSLAALAAAAADSLAALTEEEDLLMEAE